MCLTTAAYAQNASNTTKTSSSGEDEYPDLVELDPFGGISIYSEVVAGLGEKLVDGGVAGIRLAVNPSKWFGIELWADYAQANVEFKVSSGVYPPGSTFPPNGAAGTPLPTYSFGARNYVFGLNPVFNLRPRGSKVQPYLTVGALGVQYTPTDTAEGLARSANTNALFKTGNLNDNLQAGINYGGGVKWHLTDHFGLRVDVRGLWTRNPTYDLPNYNDGGVYIPAKNKLNGMQATIGLVWYFGQSKCPPMPPAPPAPAPLPTPSITGAEGTICQGKPVTLHANIAGPSGHTLQYAWTVNGQAQGGNSPDLSFTPNNTGSFTIQVTVTDTTPPPPPMERPKNFPVRCWTQPPAPQPVAPVSATATVTVNDTAPTISSVTADPNTLACAANTTGTHTSTLTGQAAASACGGNLTYKWTVSEGSVTNDTSPTATFDASTVNFEGGAQGQTKTVTATLTVTDETGKTASQSTSVTVNCQPQYVRLDDVVFAKNNTRVNNCGKRILIDDAAPRLNSGDYDIVLVGHRDSDEAAAGGRGRRGRAARRELDEQRTLNCAAVLSGGTGTCAKVDRSRVRVDWVGTDQTSETRPGLCGTSNVRERRGSHTSAADKNRRVEVYLVPRNSQTMPPAVKNIKPLPEREVRALGCPK
ncbi:MAG: PKD domain-containing protein [Acidobacteriaceae bacterium]|nr:PKD domain-containing protein [Acidobacteriaceae bacterium]